jgi:HEAT repeat protein
VPLDAQALREALREARPEVRSAAAVALGRSQAQAPEAAPLVRALAQAMAVETDAFAREAMAYALGELGAGARTGALPPLLMALEDPFPNVRFAAAIALGKTGGGPETVIALRRVLGHENRFLAFAGAVALGRVGQAASAAVPDLERLESDEREEVRVAVRFALLLIAGEQDCLAWLTQAARSGDAYSSYWSVVVLGLLQDRARTAIPLLTDILRQHGWWEMRLNAAEALLQIAPGDAATRDTIAAAAARDSNRYVAEQMRRLVAGP